MRSASKSLEPPPLRWTRPEAIVPALWVSIVTARSRDEVDETLDSEPVKAFALGVPMLPAGTAVGTHSEKGFREPEDLVPQDWDEQQRCLMSKASRLGGERVVPQWNARRNPRSGSPMARLRCAIPSAADMATVARSLKTALTSPLSFGQVLRKPNALTRSASNAVVGGPLPPQRRCLGLLRWRGSAASLPPRLCSHAAPRSGWGWGVPPATRTLTNAAGLAPLTFRLRRNRLFNFPACNSYKRDDHRDDATVRPSPPVGFAAHLASQNIGSVATIDHDFVGVPVPTGCSISISTFLTQGTRSSALRCRMPSTLIGTTSHSAIAMRPAIQGRSQDVPRQFLT